MWAGTHFQTGGTLSKVIRDYLTPFKSRQLVGQLEGKKHVHEALKKHNYWFRVILYYSLFLYI